MGRVFAAEQVSLARPVAVKMLRPEVHHAEALLREALVTGRLQHPGIVPVHQLGRSDDGSPILVMKRIVGVSWDAALRSPALVAELAPGREDPLDFHLDVLAQVAATVAFAHDQGVLHRDLRPENVMIDRTGTVKIIDFGIARSASRMTKTSLKGTLAYLAPEQLKLTPATAQSDLYSLAVSCYEALTRRKAFRGATEEELGNAILHSSPPPATEINPNVKFAVSQVLHKAMAKSPWHRFATALEFGDALRKAHRGEALEFFDTTQVKARLERATDSFEKGEHTFAAELLSELEGEGHLNPEIELLRRRIDETLRQTRIRQFLESARRFFEAEEYALALRKVQDALDIDPQGLDALALKNQIEGVRRQKKIGEWIGLARQHLANNAFRQAREALENVLKVKSTDQDALNLMAEVRRQEQEFDKAREAKAELFQSARRAWEQGDMTQALSKLQVLIKLDKQSPEGDTARSSTYQSFYNHVHSEYDSLKHGYDEAKKHLAADRLDEARRLCDQFLTKYPNHALFQALKFDVEERQRQQLSALIAETDRRVEEEADLDKRVAILEESLRQYPGEPHLERALRLTRDERDLVNSIVAKARLLEERGQMQESVDQWQILRSIHDRYPGLQFEIERLIQRRDQQAQENAKADWIKRIDHYLEEAEALCSRIAMPKQGRVVALERTSDLLKAASSNVLRFKLAVGVHNVNYLADSNPGKSGLPSVSPFLQLPGQTYDVPLTFGNGTFYFQCDPHAALGMKGHVTVAK